MTEILLWGLFFILVCIALLGCFISKFPGPILAFVGILMAKFCMQAGHSITWTNIIIIAILVIASMVLNHYLPTLVKKLHPYGKGGDWGAIVGSVLALIFTPALKEIEPAGLAISLIILSFLLLPFLFATAFEYFKAKDLMVSSRAGGSATLAYVGTTVIKVMTVIYAVYLMFANN